MNSLVVWLWFVRLWSNCKRIHHSRILRANVSGWGVVELFGSLTGWVLMVIFIRWHSSMYLLDQVPLRSQSVIQIYNGKLFITIYRAMLRNQLVQLNDIVFNLSGRPVTPADIVHPQHRNKNNTSPDLLLFVWLLVWVLFPFISADHRSAIWSIHLVPTHPHESVKHSQHHRLAVRSVFVGRGNVHRSFIY